MRTTGALGTVIAVSVTSCGHPAAPAGPVATPACAPRSDAEAQVVKAIVDMFAAVKADDRTGFHAIVAPDFYIFERGKRMDGDTIFAAIVDAQAKGRRFEWTVTQPSVRVDCNLAVITYVNVGAIGDASGMQPVSWLESAALTYDAGAWHVRFAHSTRVPQE